MTDPDASPKTETRSASPEGEGRFYFPSPLGEGGWGGEVHESAREEFTNIRVNREGRWFTGPKEIINFKVISHFKQNLFRDAKGIYIYQTFRQFAEKGYITVEGPLLSVFRIDGDRLIFDSLDAVPLENACGFEQRRRSAIYLLRASRLLCQRSRRGCAVFFRAARRAGDVFTFCGKPVEMRAITDWC
jgi:hypothetical protein